MPIIRSLPVDGFELDYSVEGRGRDALVVGSAIYYPRTFSQNLRQHLRLTFTDHRGFGRATRPFTADDFALDKLTGDIETLRQALKLEQVVIVGHSGHAYLALEYAKRYPEHVSHVVMIAQSPDSSAASYQAADRYLDESVCPERKAALAESLARLPADLAADPQNAFIHRMLRSGPRIWYDYGYDARWLWADVRVIPEMFDAVWGGLFRTLDITQGLERLDAPVLVALGRYDYWNPPHLWERVRGHFRDLSLRVFERSGHTPQLEEAELFDGELVAWLGEW
jgi:proline iminopeptidase